MKWIFIILSFIFYISCNTQPTNKPDLSFIDSITLTKMIEAREKFIQQKNLDSTMHQFSQNATFLNSAGYLCCNKNDITLFHKKMFTNDSLSYNYTIGKITIRIINPTTAIIYYPWKQNWFYKSKTIPDTLKEIGLMTVVAVKTNNQWKWVAMTNQPNKKFINNIEKHTITEFLNSINK